MPIKLVAPNGFNTSHGGDFALGDGFVMRKNPSDGCYHLPDDRAHCEPALIHQGFKRWAPPKPKPVYADEFEREANERPLDVNSILKLARDEEVELKAEGGKLRKLVVRGLSPRLAAHLKVQRIAVRSELERRQACRWSDV